MVGRVFFNSSSEGLSTLLIISLDEVKCTQDHQDISVRRLHLVSFHERSLDRVKVLKVSLGNFRELTVIRVGL
jgi:hypothetical protein